ASSAGSGNTAGIGLSFTLAIVEDTAKALSSRSLTTTRPGADVTGRASDLVDVTLSSIASSAGAKANGQSTSDGQIGNELSFANSEKGGTPESAPTAQTSAGEFGLSAAISLSLIKGESTVRQLAGTTLSTGNGSVTLEALSDFDSSATADASLVK